MCCIYVVNNIKYREPLGFLICTVASVPIYLTATIPTYYVFSKMNACKIKKKKNNKVLMQIVLQHLCDLHVESLDFVEHGSFIVSAKLYLVFILSIFKTFFLYTFIYF